MNTPMSQMPTQPATPISKVPEGMVRINTAKEMKTLKQVVVKKFEAGKLADSTQYAFSTTGTDGVEILDVFVNPVSGDCTVVYGRY